MVETTEKYRQAMASPLRPGAYARVEFDVIDPGAAADITGRSDTGRVWYSTLEGLEFDRIPEQTYSTFEPGRWVCDGEQLVPSEENTVEQGFVGDILSDENGVYQSQPAVRFDFGQQRTFRALTLWFDPSHGDHPALVRAIGYRDGTETVRVDTVPEDAEAVLRPDVAFGFRNVDRVDIIWLESGKAYRRPRLQMVLFGYTHTVESTDPESGSLESINCSAQSDPLNREIAYQDATVNLIDHSGIYAIDNPEGIWEDIETRIPMRIYFGTLIPYGNTWGDVYKNYTWREMNRKTWSEAHDGGYYETFLGGSYWLNAEPQTIGRYASFKGVSIVDLLEADFKRWPVSGGNLFDLAELVLNSVELPRQRDGGSLWHLWDGLKNITTTAPMPVKSCREILQDIAIAGRCTIFFDRMGAMHIEPLPETQYDFDIDFTHCQVELPGGKKVPELGGVEASYYKYRTGDSRELHNESYAVSAGETVEVVLPGPASNVTVSAAGGSVQVYSSAVFVTYAQAGTYTIVVTGRDVEESASVVSLPVEDARPAAAWASVECPLLVSRAEAMQCGQWYADWLLHRLTYNVQSIGYPEVDIYDKIYTQSRFNGRLPAWVFAHSLRYTGGFWSDFTVKVDS